MAEFPHPEYRNYVTNPSLEADDSDWGLYQWSGTGVRTSGGGAAGEWFYRLTNTANGKSGYAGRYHDVPVAVKAGETYTLSIHVRPSRTIEMQAQGEFRGRGGVVGPVAQKGPLTLCPAGVWTRLHLTMTATGNADTIRHQTYLINAVLNAGDTLDLDAECIAKGELTHYFDGSGILPMETLKRRNLAINPLGPGMTNVDNWRGSPGDTLDLADNEGRKVAALIEGGSSTALYMDPTDNFSPPVGTKIHALAEVKVLSDSGASMRIRFPAYSGASISDPNSVPDEPQFTTNGWKQYEVNATVAAMPEGGYTRGIIYPGTGSVSFWETGSGYWVRNYLIEYNTTGPFFDGDTPASGNLSYRWAPDGTSLEVETIQPPTGRTVVWDGEPYKSTSTLWIGDTAYATGVFEVGASTDARLGIVSDIYSRSREKIQLKLARVDDLVRSGHRIELAAAAMTSTPAVWHWRQVTGPTVALNVRENTCDFIAPDVERSTRIRIGVYAASEDGANRSDWHYFDLDVEPPMLRFRGGDDGDFSPRSPYLVGYSRGKREIWNDVIRPATYEKNPRHELEVVDLGVPDNDVVFSTETPKRMAAGGVWVNPETGDVFRNFGTGYNETDDTTASPRTSTYWVNPANGDILEWIED